MQENYKPLEIESEVQAQWEESGVFRASDAEGAHYAS
jgi:leucyl-tRNA synthetase